MIIWEFNYLNGKIEAREYDPLSEDCLSYICNFKGWGKQQAIDYSRSVIDKIEKAGGILKTNTGFLRFKKGQEDLSKFIQELNSPWN